MFARKNAWVRIIVILGCVVVLKNLSLANAENPSSSEGNTIAQSDITGTPGIVVLPTMTSTPEPPTPSPTRTPTSLGPAVVEARNPDTNVRAGPDTSADRLGIIQPGEQYIVLGRLYEWFQIQYPNSPSRIAWVYQGVVNVFGDESRIPDLTVDQIPTIDPTFAAQEETEIAITQTPGGVLTATANALFTPEGFITATPELIVGRTLAPGERLPTFTFPPFTNTPISVEDLRGPATVLQEEEGGFAPAIPILGLAALGLLGIFIEFFRRL